MRSLITGVGGFVGQHLAMHLLSQGETVLGATRGDVGWHAPELAERENFGLLAADLLDRAEAFLAVERAAPDRVYHLAAMSSVADSFADPIAAIHQNVALQVNVLESVRMLAPKARVLIVSSSEIYGRSAGHPIDETEPFAPESPYAVSKVAQDLLGYQYSMSYDLDIVRVRPFNHIGPGQSDRFVAASFGRQIAEIEAGKRDPVIKVGNLDSKRDLTDVRDMVRAYHLALLRGERRDAYNLGTDRAVSIRDLLDRFIALSRVPVREVVDEERLRPSDAPVILCNSGRFRRLTEWTPAIPLDTTVADILSYWRARIRAA